MGADAALRAPSGHVFLGGAPLFEQRAQDAFVADAVDECLAYAPLLQAALRGCGRQLRLLQEYS